MDYISPELIRASGELAGHVKKSSEAMWDKIQASKKKDSQKETISDLEEIIQNLIDDKNELIQIAQVYDEEIIAQKITEEEMKYISETIIPLLREFFEDSGDNENLENLEKLSPLLSKDTINIMQLIGFNFKQAIGEPLTDLCAAAIRKQKPITVTQEELLKADREKEREFYKMIQNEEAYERFLFLTNQK
ncbi:hypothetical protein J2R98_000509 [Alkalibacillus filiformis]|uniref:Uncharacterized protein n=1 Tax=Alkalibacillus filiformis TaxID=200990 RepID=A0ABU0DQI8_9BACI|nr:hypothetical protein [Alkalibacillus filiformis]MDQ0350706.1 hypothetical protein [Alkalibacillus filiformis]